VDISKTIKPWALGLALISGLVGRRALEVKKRGLKSHTYSTHFGTNEQYTPEFCWFHPFQ